LRLRAACGKGGFRAKSFFSLRFQRMGKGGFHAKNHPCNPKLHQWFPWIPVAGSTQGLIALNGRFIPISTSLQRLFYLFISSQTLQLE
jgi:hypothetical protein